LSGVAKYLREPYLVSSRHMQIYFGSCT
jgi:hypothetical protein